MSLWNKAIAIMPSRLYTEMEYFLESEYKRVRTCRIDSNDFPDQEIWVRGHERLACNYLNVLVGESD